MSGPIDPAGADERQQDVPRAGIASKTTTGPPVHCDHCEAVCCRLTVVLMPEDRVPAWLVDDGAQGLPTLAKNDEDWCAAIDPLSFRCMIYADRPSICRAFSMGGADCRGERARWFDPATPSA